LDDRPATARAADQAGPHVLVPMGAERSQHRVLLQQLVDGCQVHRQVPQGFRQDQVEQAIDRVGLSAQHVQRAGWTCAARMADGGRRRRTTFRLIAATLSRGPSRLPVAQCEAARSADPGVDARGGHRHNFRGRFELGGLGGVDGVGVPPPCATASTDSLSGQGAFCKREVLC
jgi:hypothetical protein